MPDNKDKENHGSDRKKAGSRAGDAVPGAPDDLFVVGIGASAGGLEALEALFEHMPGQTGMAFVVITHLHPGHESLLPELLSKKTRLTVETATDRTPVQPDHIYVASPGVQLSIVNGSLQCHATGTGESPRMPVNFFLRSLAEDQREKAICIILSGTGSDGTLGLRAVKEHAGMIMVEEPDAAQYAGMPESAVHTGLADFVLPPAAMPAQLLQYRSGRSLATEGMETGTESTRPKSLQKIFHLLRGRLGHDFSEYKLSTIRRRVKRRMALQQIASYDDYLKFLHRNPEEVDTLFHEFLISVTSFFRDPEAWAALAPYVEALVDAQTDDSAVRAWVPGCCTGEEVYSLAIMLHEAMVKLNKYPDVQVFGTDLDPTAIERARVGLYPEDIVSDITPQRLQRYFTHGAGGYRIRKDIRDMAIFAQQNVVKDPPFTRLDLISCRNLLIYLQHSLQNKLLPLFHYALNPNGLLFLGPSETIGQFDSLFEPRDKRWKLFSRKQTPAQLPALANFPVNSHGDHEDLTLQVVQTGAQAAGLGRLVERLLLSRFAPASVIVSGEGDIVYLYGRTGAYLEPPEGRPRNNIVEMAREGLRVEMAEALKKSSAADTPVTRRSVRVTNDGNTTAVDLSVEKLHQPGLLHDLFLVTLQPSARSVFIPRQETGEISSGPFSASRVEQLERELRYAKESNQITLEELETSNEELKSINEELQSTNEELQSTNEELVTSREEMHSLNEELTTVNAELQPKVAGLTEANEEMQNLLNNINIAVIFLDNELQVKRFTEEAHDVVFLRATDIGRPISELAITLQNADLLTECQTVQSNLVYKEAEVRAQNGVVYLMRIMPYRTARNVIDGLVLTFVNISRLKIAEQELRLMSQVFQKGPEPIILVDPGGDIIDINERAAANFGYTSGRLVGHSVGIIVAESHREQLFAGLERCRSNELVRNIRSVLIAGDEREIPVELTLALLTEPEGPGNAIAVYVKHPVDGEQG